MTTIEVVAIVVAIVMALVLCNVSVSFIRKGEQLQSMVAWVAAANCLIIAKLFAMSTQRDAIAQQLSR